MQNQRNFVVKNAETGDNIGTFQAATAKQATNKAYANFIKKLIKLINYT